MFSSKTVLNVAVTGGVGSGKSTVCGFFRSAGYPVYDADLICREALPSVSALLLSRWGGDIIKTKGGGAVKIEGGDVKKSASDVGASVKNEGWSVKESASDVGAKINEKMAASVGGVTAMNVEMAASVGGAVAINGGGIAPVSGATAISWEGAKPEEVAKINEKMAASADGAAKINEANAEPAGDAAETKNGKIPPRRNASTIKWCEMSAGKVAVKIDEREFPTDNPEGEAREARSASPEDGGKICSATPPDVELDRRKIAEIVFNDPAELSFLNSIMHRVAKEKIAEIRAGKLDGGKNGVRFVEVPLLYETGMDADFDFTVCVWSPECRSPELRKRAAFQMDPLEKLRRADFAIINASGRNSLYEQCLALLERLKREIEQ